MIDLSALVARLSPAARASLAGELANAGTPMPGSADPIAVVGAGCRFPGGADAPPTYWTSLREGRDGVRKVPADRWDADAYYDPDPAAPGRIPSRWGGFLDDVAAFDAEYFGITPTEAQALDPQQRMLLEVGFEALSHASIVPASLRATRTGVFVGMASSDYLVLGVENRAPVDAYTSTGNPHSTAVGRLSYTLDARGPSVAVDTACSSSLVAVHMACQSLRCGESDTALAGGVHLVLTPTGSVALAKWSMLAPDGRCKAFDAAADGFVRGEGCGMVVLKRLSDARRDGNRVLAVIRGSAVNSDGRSNGLTAPNIAAQRGVIADALRAAAVPAETVGFVETHGTGTSLGDPIEFDALASAYGTGESPCALGAVKTNFGHLEAAAGIAGLLKAVLAVHHGEIPPNLHFQRWNPSIDAGGTRFFIPDKPTPWPVVAGPRRAAVSAFGFGGTNAHLVVEEAPPAERSSVWVFPGQGAQWAGMGQRMLAEEPAFAAAVDRLDETFRTEAGFALRALLESADEVTGIDRVQPAIFGMQVALAEMWRARGERPAAVIGHSMGEVAAAVVAGALSLQDGVRVIVRRSRLLRTISGAGAMAVVSPQAEEGTGLDAVTAMTADFPGVEVAVHTAPGQYVMAGDAEQIERLITWANDEGVEARMVKVDVASHSPQVDPLLGELQRALAEITGARPQIPFYSTVGESAPSFDAAYWVANLRRPVRFTQAVAAAVADGHTDFRELSPHPLLSEAIRATAAERRVTVAPSLLRPPRWRHDERHWLRETPNPGQGGVHPLLGVHVSLPDGRHCFQADVGTAAHPWLDDHQVHGAAVLPAAAYLELALAAARHGYGVPAEQLALAGLELRRVLPLSAHTPITTVFEPATGKVTVHAREHGSWAEYATGQVTRTAGEAASRLAPAPTGPAGSPGELYAGLRQAGQLHGPAFAAVTGLPVAQDGRAVAELRLPAEAGETTGYLCHPVLIDACFQALSAASPGNSDPDVTYLPLEIGTARIRGPIGRIGRAHAALRQVDGESWLGEVTLADADGGVLAEVTDVYIRRVDRSAVRTPLRDTLFGLRWEPAALPEADPAPASWLVLAPDTAAPAAAELTARLTALGDQVHRGPLLGGTELRDRLDAASADPGRPLRGVLVLHETTPRLATASDAVDPGDALEHAETLLLDVASAATGLATGPAGPRLWIVTHGGVDEPATGSLRGLVRVLAYEHPNLRATHLAFDAFDSDVLSAEVRGDGPDDEVVWDGGERRTARAVRVAPPQPPGDPVIHADGGYLVTGGLGGLGVATAQWLVASGAGRVVLNGRSSPGAETERRIAELTDAGADVRVVLGDLSEPGTAERCVSASTGDGVTLRGVLHAAAVLDDRTVSALDAASVRRVWAPKVRGAWRLHQATADRQLDFFLLFSSAASLMGSPGQAAYSAANAWLDAFAGWRRARGLPATAINWGPWAEIGLAKDQQAGAMRPITPDEGLQALEVLLAADRPATAVARLAPDVVLAAYPHLAELPFFGELLAGYRGGQPEDDWPGPQALADCAPEEARKRVADRLRARTAAVMGHQAARIDPSRPLTSLGLDSLLAMRVRNAVADDFGVTLPVALLLQGTSLHELEAEIATRLSLAPAAAEPTTNVTDRARERGAARAARLRRANRRTQA